MIPQRPVLPDATPPRRLRNLGAGYTWFVRIARMALPLIALVIVGVVAAKMTMDQEQQQISALPPEEKTAPGEIEIRQAKYEGVDADGRAYTLTADDARREMDAPDTMRLTNPKADITTPEGGWLIASANTGAYNNAASTLSLEGDVAVFHDLGYEVHLQKISIDIKKNQANSPLPVTAQGPAGRLEAQGLLLLDQGQRIVFTGPAKLVLRLEALKNGDKG